MDVIKARELLGKEGEKMTDEEVMKTEQSLRTLANIMIDKIIKMTPKERDALNKKIKKEKAEKKLNP